MKTYSLKILIVALLFVTSVGLSQTKGLIYKPAGDALGKSVLDPNGDGYTSPTVSGFVGTDFGTGSELNMVTLPILGTEPASDVRTGPAGGFTDLVTNGQFESSYILYRTVAGIDYLIARFRLGGTSTAPKGYSLLFDTDNNITTNYSAGNPGFEREVILQPNVGVIVNSLNANVTQLASFNADNYQQRSIALSNISGTPDYFYDFFVPVSSLNISGPVRILVTTVIAAGQSGITGTLSDINGVNDALYGGNTNAIFRDVISTFPLTNLSSLTSGSSFAAIKTSTPAITSAIASNSPTIRGSSQEANGTIITILKNGVSIGTTTVNNNAWELTGVSGLVAGDLITATALASSKSASAISTAVEVTGVQSCTTALPVITTRGSQQTYSGTWSNGGTIAPNTVQIRIYDQTANNTFIEVTSALPVYVATDGTWAFTANLLSQSQYNLTTAYARATVGTCTSGYSNVSFKTNGPTGTATTAPSISTTTILASPTVSRSVTVTNLDLTASVLILYINGTEVARSASTIATNGSHTFNYTGFIDGDFVSARAQSASADYWLSNRSTTTVTVSASATVTDAPVITSTTLTAGSGRTITGTSTERAGSTISVFKNGNILLGTTTVNAFGSWSLAGVTLVASDAITATAKALGETTSVISNSITVVAGLPAVPVVSSPINAFATTISGTGGSGIVTVYADGFPIGTTTSGPNWTLAGIDPLNINRGAVITATNTVSGVQSAPSAGVTVIGAASFCITDTAGNPISDKKSGESFSIMITAITGTLCPGTVYTGFTGSVVLSSSTTTILSGAGQTANFVNGVLTTTAIALGVPGAGIIINAISTTDPTAVGSSSPINVFNTAWKGTTSTDFNTPSNWIGNFVPVSGAYIFYDVPTINDCILDLNRTVGSINFNGTNKNMNINGHTLTVNGTISGITSTGGLFTGSATSNLIFGGEGNAGTFFMNQTAPLTTNFLNNLTINKLSSGSVTLGNNLNIVGVLASNTGTLNTGNAITFKSTAINTAVVSPVKGIISGMVTVERYIPAKRAFRFLSSSVTTTTSIRDNWQEGQNNTTTSLNSDTNPGWGTHITGSATGSNGFDATQTTNPSLFKFVNNTGSWTSGISNTNVNTLTAGVPYRLFIRGNRSVDLNSNTATSSITTLRATGTLYTGAKVVTDLNPNAGGDSFIGNPYQSPVDMNLLLQASTNLNKVFYYVWDPNVNTRGGYVSVTVGTGVVSNLSSAANKFLQPSQGCFVTTNLAGAASLTFEENYKQTNTANVNVFKATNTQPSLRLSLYEANAFLTTNNRADGLLIEFNPNQTNNIDGNDAKKFTNIDENFAIKNNETLLSIENRALPISTEIIPLHLSNYRHTNYTIVAEAQNIEGVTPYLFDKFTQSYTEIPANVATAYNYSVVSGNPLSTSSTRFDIVFSNVSLGTEPNELAGKLQLHPNPAKDGWFIVSSSAGNQDMDIQIFNILGQEISYTASDVDANSKKIEISKSTTKGVYMVQINQNGQVSTKKIIIN